MRYHIIKKPATETKIFAGRRKAIHMPKISKKGNPYKFSMPEYICLKKHLVEIYMLGFDPWPTDQGQWPKPKNAPGYIVKLYEQSNGRPFLIISFSNQIETPSGTIGNHFRIGGTSHYYNPIF